MYIDVYKNVLRLQKALLRVADYHTCIKGKGMCINIVLVYSKNSAIKTTT